MQNRSNEWQGSGAIIDGKSNKCRNGITLEQPGTVLHWYENNRKICDDVHITGLNKVTLTFGWHS